MTDIFNELSVIGVEMGEEDHVVHLLASLPDSYNTLVTALEVSPDVPKMDVVTEKVLYEERKLKDHDKNEEALSAKHRFDSRGPKCHFCHKFGHIQRYCTERARSEKKPEGTKVKKEKKTMKQRAQQVQARRSDSNTVGLATCHVLSVNTSYESKDAWIIDSGATCHICNNRQLFAKYQTLKKPQSLPRR